MMRRLIGHCALVFAFLGLAFGTAQADPGFYRWVADFWQTARAAGISRDTYEQAFRGVRLDPEVLEKARYQPEFVKPIWDYVDGAVSQERIHDGQAMLRQHERTLAALERAFGVDRHILVAIWGMESSYGEVLNNPKIVRSTIQSLATLAYDCRRSEFFTQHLFDALRIVQRGDLAPAQMRGAWAGELGQTQFMASSYYRFAIDFDGDGRRDLLRSVPDALASTANYLRAHGWQRGQPWTPGSPNFQALKGWNRSDVYARTIGSFAGRLRGENATQ